MTQSEDIKGRVVLNIYLKTTHWRAYMQYIFVSMQCKTISDIHTCTVRRYLQFTVSINCCISLSGLPNSVFDATQV